MGVALSVFSQSSSEFQQERVPVGANQSLVPSLKSRLSNKVLETHLSAPISQTFAPIAGDCNTTELLDPSLAVVSKKR